MHDTISIIYVIMGHNFGNKYLPNQLVPTSPTKIQKATFWQVDKKRRLIQMLKAFG